MPVSFFVAYINKNKWQGVFIGAFVLLALTASLSNKEFLFRLAVKF